MTDKLELLDDYTTRGIAATILECLIADEAAAAADSDPYVTGIKTLRNAYGISLSAAHDGWHAVRGSMAKDLGVFGAVPAVGGDAAEAARIAVDRADVRLDMAENIALMLRLLEICDFRLIPVRQVPAT